MFFPLLGIAYSPTGLMGVPGLGLILGKSSSVKRDFPVYIEMFLGDIIFFAPILLIPQAQMIVLLLKL